MTAPPRSGHARRSSAGLAAQQARLAWILLAPSLAVAAVVALYPAITTIYRSFTNDTFGGTSSWIGLGNYTTLLEDAAFWSSVWITIEFSVITVAIEAVLGMILALTLHSVFIGRGIMRALLLVPFAIINVISASIWKLMFNQSYGVFNDLLVDKLHLASEPFDFFGTRTAALLSVSAIDVWKTTPFMALLLLAGLQSISRDTQEAAQVDGAGPVRRFFSITLPQLRPALLVALVFRSLDALRVFDVFYVLFGARADTTTMSIYIEQNIVDFGKAGYGSAISVAAMLLIAVFITMYVGLNARMNNK
ncbi:carbohydrate ABC transporter permease [Nonomuraea sp. H19]|uniref:carbohydrate ABC transporter permease n=1 Tax=Nonomuraea sp. H19 TaxID=3452206 RepID=UPI003F8CEA90